MQLVERTEESWNVRTRGWLNLGKIGNVQCDKVLVYGADAMFHDNTGTLLVGMNGYRPDPTHLFPMSVFVINCSCAHADCQPASLILWGCIIAASLLSSLENPLREQTHQHKEVGFYGTSPIVEQLDP